ncbi:MAG TPA: hypothetical protein VFM15_06185 [Gammaproteobacteria bacterium]|nr:hypothetical protein [Gammaproteobacteria bacterium]
MLGEFLEISIATTDILAAIRFYERLGFRQAPVGEIWQHPYAVLSDGRIALGLHKYSFPSPALTFVLPELRAQLDAFEQAGIAFAFRKLAENEFNEAGFYSPDRQMVTLLEARTYSPLHDAGASGCGYFLEYRMPSSDCTVGCGFWETLGLVTTAVQARPAQAQLARSGLNLGLHERGGVPQLVFVNEQPAALTALLDARDIPFRQEPDYDGAPSVCIAAPDGLVLRVRERDY